MTEPVIQLSSSVNPVLPDAASSLERAWQRRRQELAGWQPSGGWLLKPRTVQRRVPKSLARKRA